MVYSSGVDIGLVFLTVHDVSIPTYNSKTPTFDSYLECYHGLTDGIDFLRFTINKRGFQWISSDYFLIMTYIYLVVRANLEDSDIDHHNGETGLERLDQWRIECAQELLVLELFPLGRSLQLQH